MVDSAAGPASAPVISRLMQPFALLPLFAPTLRVVKTTLHLSFFFFSCLLFPFSFPFVSLLQLQRLDLWLFSLRSCRSLTRSFVRHGQLVQFSQKVVGQLFHIDLCRRGINSQARSDKRHPKLKLSGPGPVSSCAAIP